ncbi:MAG: hypothetical protein AB8B57_07480 [Congregibacter sp.]
MYLARIKRLDGLLNAVVTTTDARALDQAKTVDAGIATGHYRGPALAA